MDVAVRIEKKSDVLFLSEKAQSTIQELYTKVSEWQRKPTSTFYLSNNGILLGRQATATISSLPVSTTAMGMFLFCVIDFSNLLIQLTFKSWQQIQW
jgi:hypothetical protein